MRPGTNAETGTSVSPKASPTDTGSWFVSGYTSQGPDTPVVLTNFAQFQKVFGKARGTFSAMLYDCLEVFFSKGGARAVVSRIVPAEAVAAEKASKGEVETAKTCLIAKARGVGTWGNSVEVVIGGAKEAFTITVKYEGSEEKSPIFKTCAEAITWSKGSQYIELTQGEVEETPKAATLKLENGVNGKAGIGVDTETKESEALAAALALFIEEYGPGQISAPGIVKAKSVKVLYEAATKQNRCAVADGALGASEAELKAQAKLIEEYGEAARNGAFYASWQTIPPALGLVTNRTVPLSPWVAAKANVIDGEGNPNIAIAGANGILEGSLGQSTEWGNAGFEALAEAGVNCTKVVNGQIRIYGNRTCCSPETEPDYTQFSNSRLDMAIIWNALAIEQEYVFSQLDGEGKDTSKYGLALKGMMLDYYKVGAVFGESPSDAYSVDTSGDVNTPTTEGEGKLLATIACRRSPSAELVSVKVVRVGLTQEV